MDINPLSKEFFAREFQKEYFLFHAENPPIIGSFQFARLQGGYVAFRVLLALYYLYRIYMASTGYNEKLPFFLNLYSYTTIFLFMGATTQLVCSVHRLWIGDREMIGTPVLYIITWIAFTLKTNISSCAVILASFKFCYAEQDFAAIGLVRPQTAINGLILLLDFMVCGIPIRLLHFYLGLVLYVPLVIANIVYRETVTDDACNTFANYSTVPAFLLFLCIVVMTSVICHSLVFLCYWIRLLLCWYVCCCWALISLDAYELNEIPETNSGEVPVEIDNIPEDDDNAT